VRLQISFKHYAIVIISTKSICCFNALSME
jgi:hypothetical protein